MKSIMTSGELNMNVIAKTIAIYDLNYKYLVEGSSLFTFDTTKMDWYTSEFIQEFKVFGEFENPWVSVPYLLKNHYWSIYK